MAIYGQVALSVEGPALVQVRDLSGHIFFEANLADDLDDEKSCMLLVMRVLSIVPLNFKVILETVHGGPSINNT